MTPEREKNMRLNLAELTQEQLSDTCVNLQRVVDDHVNEKTGMKSQITVMGNQIPALHQKIKDLEEAADDTTQVGTVEWEALQEQNAELVKRTEELQRLNEGLQKKLIGDL